MRIGIIIIGLIFLANGILILKKKRFGPEEGMRGNVYKGKIAILSGVVFTIIGLAAIIAALLK